MPKAYETGNAASVRRRTARRMVTIAVLAAAGWAVWHYLLFPSAEVRFRISVNISDHAGNRYSGNGIWGVHFQTGWQIPGNGPSYTAGVNADAIRIGLKNNRNVWVSIAPSAHCDDRDLPFRDFSTSPPGLILNMFHISPLSRNFGFVQSLPKNGDRAVLGTCDLPQIVEFEDEKAPTSAKIVLFDAKKRADCCDLTLDGASLTVLSDNTPVTRAEVDRFLPWVPEPKPGRLAPTRYVLRDQQESAEPLAIWDSAFMRRDY